MKRKPTDARAVFHDRAAMEEAVHALELEGVRRRRIRVWRADASGRSVRKAPESSTALSIGGALGSAAGGALALWSFAFALGEAPFWLVVVRVLAGAATGAILGALIALVTSRLRHESRYEQPAGYKDFVVKVKTPDPATADHVRDLLERAGGDPLPA